MLKSNMEMGTAVIPR